MMWIFSALPPHQLFLLGGGGQFFSIRNMAAQPRCCCCRESATPRIMFAQLFEQLCARRVMTMQRCLCYQQETIFQLSGI